MKSKVLLQTLMNYIKNNLPKNKVRLKQIKKDYLPLILNKQRVKKNLKRMQTNLNNRLTNTTAPRMNIMNSSKICNQKLKKEMIILTNI